MCDENVLVSDPPSFFLRLIIIKWNRLGRRDAPWTFWERVPVPFTHGTCSLDAASERTGRAPRTLQRVGVGVQHNKSWITTILMRERRTGGNYRAAERERRRRRGRKLVGEIAEGFFSVSFLSSNSVHIYRRREDGTGKKKTAIASWSMWEIERYCRRHWLETLTFPRSGRDKRLTRLTEGVNTVSEGRVWKTQPFFPIRINSLGGSWERDKSPQQIRS